MDESAMHVDAREVAAGHAPETARMRALWLFLLGLMLMLVIALAVVMGVSWMYTGQAVVQSRGALPTELPRRGTAHWVNPPADLARLRARQHALLSGYGWVDREANVARIPIEQAMRVVAEGGER